MSIPKLIAAGFIVLVVALFLHKAEQEGRRAPPPDPPTPARIAYEAERRAEEATAGLARRQAEAAAAAAARTEVETVLADGPGRAETFGYCTACHNTALIRRSAFTRDRWDELMDWMTEKQGMNPLEGELRETIVDYLAGQYGPRQRGPRGGNPFLD